MGLYQLLLLLTGEGMEEWLLKLVVFIFDSPKAVH